MFWGEKIAQHYAKGEIYPALAFFIEVAISTNLSSVFTVQMYERYLEYEKYAGRFKKRT